MVLCAMMSHIGVQSRLVIPLCVCACNTVPFRPCFLVGVQDGSLESFAPRRPPYVPSLLVHCAKEVEKRGLMEMGIYRLSGYVSVVVINGLDSCVGAWPVQLSTLSTDQLWAFF